MKRKTVIRGIALFLTLVSLLGCTAAPAEPSDTGGTLGTIGVLTPPVTQPVTEPAAPTVPPFSPVLEVATFDELTHLVTGDTLCPGDTLRLTAPMEITKEVVIPFPVSLCVEADITCTYPITLDTMDEGIVIITLSDGVDTAGLDIRLDAPNCDVWWQSGCPYKTELEAAELTNVRTFNGADLRTFYGLGGTGQRKIAAFSLEPEQNSGLDSALNFCLEGNTLYLAVSYLTPDSVLENAVVTVATDDGGTETVPMDLTEGIHYYTASDEAGEARTYKVITQRITYNLPVLYIEIEGGKEVTSREYYLNATLRIDAENAAGDFPSLDTTQILIRGRGHYSWNFDKTPYKIRFEKKTSVLGLEASKNWVLLANYVDRSLIQNYVAMEMGKVMTNICYHSNQYPVDVFVNGSYRGVYTFGEQLEAKEERIDLEQGSTDPNTDYLLEVGGTDDGDVYLRDYFHAVTMRHIAIKHPESSTLTDEQLDYIISYVKAADDAVRTLSNYEDYIDVDSLIDWVIIHELTYNLDCCFRRSCYLIKEKDGKLKMGPIWDFDLAFGSHYRYQSGDWATIGENGGYVGVTWMNYLIKDEAFMARMRERWNEIKKPLLNTALSCIEEMSELVAPSAEMNFEVWDLLGKSAPAQPSSHKKYDTYEKMIGRLEKFIQDRYNWLDAQLN